MNNRTVSILVSGLFALACIFALVPAGRAEAFCTTAGGGYCGNCQQPPGGHVACPLSTTGGSAGSGSSQTTSSGGTSGTTSSGSTTGGSSNPSPTGSSSSGSAPTTTLASTNNSGPTIDLPHAHATKATIKHLLEIVFGIAGALALLFIVISGFRYILSSGDPQAVTKAKDGLIYAVVGLAVCILAEALVTFVVGAI